MKVGSFLAFVGWVALAGLGVGVTWFAVDPEVRTVVIEWAGSLAETDVNRTAMIAAGAGMVAIALLSLLVPVARARREKILDFTSEVGKMIIEVSALEEFIVQVARDDSDVTSAIASIAVSERGSGAPIVCDMHVGIVERSDVPGKGAQLAHTIRDSLQDIVPTDTDPVVNMKIRIERAKRAKRSVRLPRHVGVAPLGTLTAAETMEQKRPLSEKKKSGGEKERVSREVSEFTGAAKYPTSESEEEIEQLEDLPAGRRTVPAFTTTSEDKIEQLEELPEEENEDKD